ncbi:sigma-70 family RNA polymerase sigma factor [Amycolatopsis sp. cg9]|uniref:sigma-70 family RNA polymerase sigma factor n=1 Tax=Amycolatopsis sp. cg9 TaxID=3238801 RepID=UPI00352491DD
MTSDWGSVPASQGGPDLAKLLRLVGPEVEKYARARTRRLDPEEVVYETLLRLRRYLNRNPRADPEVLVRVALTIARNFLIDDSRSSRREVPLPAEDLISIEALRESDFADERAEITDALDALRALPDDLQEVVTLACLNERSFPEVAQILGISVRTVQRRYRKGRERLRRALGTHHS